MLDDVEHEDVVEVRNVHGKLPGVQIPADELRPCLAGLRRRRREPVQASHVAAFSRQFPDHVSLAAG